MGGSQQSATRVQGAVHEECAGCELTAGFHTRTSCTSTASCTRAHCTHLLARGCLGGIAAPGPHFARGLLAPGPTHLPCPNPPQTLYPPPINTCTTGGGHIFIWNRGGGRMHEGRARVHGDSCKALQGSCKAHVRLLKTLEGCARPDGALRDSCKARRGRAKACETRVRTSRCHGKPRRAPQASCKARRSRARPRGTRARLDGAAHHHGGLVQEPREATAGRARPRRPRAKPRTAPGGNGARPCERRGHL